MQRAAIQMKTVTINLEYRRLRSTPDGQSAGRRSILPTTRKLNFSAVRCRRDFRHAGLNRGRKQSGSALRIQEYLSISAGQDSFRSSYSSGRVELFPRSRVAPRFDGALLFDGDRFGFVSSRRTTSNDVVLSSCRDAMWHARQTSTAVVKSSFRVRRSYRLAASSRSRSGLSRTCPPRFELARAKTSLLPFVRNRSNDSLASSVRRLKRELTGDIDLTMQCHSNASTTLSMSFR